MEHNHPQPTEALDCICPGYTWDGKQLHDVHDEPSAIVAGCPYHDSLDGGGIRDLGDAPFPPGLGPDVDRGPAEPTMYGDNQDPTPHLAPQEDDGDLRAVSGESASVPPSGDPAPATVRATDQVDPRLARIPQPLDLPGAGLVGRLPVMKADDRGNISFGRPTPAGERTTATIQSGHWADSPDAALIRRIFRRLPPMVWDVDVSIDWGTNTVDVASAHGLIAAILNAAHVEQATDHVPLADLAPGLEATLTHLINAYGSAGVRNAVMQFDKADRARPYAQVFDGGDLLTPANADLCACGEVAIAHGTPFVVHAGRRHSVDQCRRMIRDNPQA